MLPVECAQQRLLRWREPDGYGDLVRDDGPRPSGETLHDLVQHLLTREPGEGEQRVQLSQGVLGQEGLDQGADRVGHVGQRTGAVLQSLHAQREIHPAVLLAPLHEHVDHPAARVGGEARATARGGALHRVGEAHAGGRGGRAHAVGLREEGAEFLVAEQRQLTVRDLHHEVRVGQRAHQPGREARVLAVVEHASDHGRRH